jgi:excisionase family DNA binding protein
MILKTVKSTKRKGKLFVLKLKRDAFLTTQEVARWLGNSPRTISALAERWHDTGGLEGIPAFKVGRAWRFDAERLENWVTQQQDPNRHVHTVSNTKPRSIA